jgi:hypothetical protein
MQVRAWTEGLLSEIQGMSTKNVGKHLSQARVETIERRALTGPGHARSMEEAPH